MHSIVITVVFSECYEAEYHSADFAAKIYYFKMPRAFEMIKMPFFIFQTNAVVPTRDISGQKTH
jgi:hypothetical protein